MRQASRDPRSQSPHVEPRAIPFQYKADYIAELEDSVREDMAAGVPREDIVASIEEAGLPRDDAALIVAKVESARLEEIRNRYARKHVHSA